MDDNENNKIIGLETERDILVSKVSDLRADKKYVRSLIIELKDQLINDIDLELTPYQLDYIIQELDLIIDSVVWRF